MTRENRRAMIVPIAVAFFIAAAGFAAAQVFGEGAGMPLVAIASSIWTGLSLARPITRADIAMR